MRKETLSPHELNKFSYCPHQWYYEKVYGSKELRRLRKLYLEEQGVQNDPTQSNFVRGEQFHQKKYRFLYLRHRILQMLMWIVLLAIMVYGAYYYDIL